MSETRARALLNETWRETQVGNLKGALADAELGLRSFSAQDSELHWRFRNLKAEILMRQRRDEDALSQLSPEPPPALADTDIPVWRQLTLGAAHVHLSSFPEAESALSSAKQLATRSFPHLLGEVYLRQGSAQFEQGHVAESLPFYRKALDFAREKNDFFLQIAALGNLGRAAIRQEHYDEAVDLNKSALALADKVHDLSSVARINGNIGWGLRKVGDFDNALEFDKAAAEGDIAAGNPDRRVTWLNAAGEVHYDKHQFGDAESKSSEALGLANSLNVTEDAIYSLQNLALIALAREQFSAAKNYIEDALSREVPPNHDRALSSELILAQLSVRTGDLSNAESSFRKIMEDSSSTLSIQWVAQAGLAQVHASQGHNSLAESEFRQSISSISAAQDSIKREEFRLSFLSSAIRFYDEYVSFLLAQNRTIDALKIADLSRAQTLERGLALKSSNGATSPENLVAKSAPPQTYRPKELARRQNATILFYWLGQKRSLLWVVTPSKTSLIQLPPADELNSAARAYRDSFTLPVDPLESGNRCGAYLYQTLLRPVANLIPKNSRVIILPDQDLNGLNFETLLVADPKPHYWIEDVTVSIASSLALLARSRREPPPASPDLLLFGDALFATKEFPVLPDSGKEIDLLKKYFPESRRQLFTRADARPSSYRSSNVEQFSYLHFSTHGTASLLQPLDSAIILSPEGDLFKLYARDIVQRPLNAYLVTISACNGTGTKVYAGEGLIGLSWAFLRAGAHNVVAGLWEVSNASTPELMDELYKGLHRGEEPAVALRNAKLTLLHSTRVYRRPFYWAPFQLYSGS